MKNPITNEFLLPNPSLSITNDANIAPNTSLKQA